MNPTSGWGAQEMSQNTCLTDEEKRLTTTLPPPPPPPVCPLHTSPVCTFNTSSCVPAPRAHVETRLRVVPIHTGTYRTYTRGRVFQRVTHTTPSHTPHHNTRHNIPQHTTRTRPQNLTKTETERDRDRQRQRERQRKKTETEKEEKREERRD